MPFRDTPAKLLEDILTDIAKIERFMQGVDHAAFEQDDQVAYAVKYALLRISEAAYRLKDVAAELCPDVPWRDIRGIGNRLRHAYDTIDIGLIWMVVEKNLSPLKASVQDALQKLNSNTPPPS